MSIMGSDQQFCLQWHNYQSSLLALLPHLLDSEDLTDVTLSAGGRNIKAHRVILSACSQYFKDLFKVLPPMQHPVIVLPGTNFTDLCALVTFMYSGEVNIYQEQLQGILSMADAMQIRGLAEVNGGSQNEIKKDGQCSTKRPRLPAIPNLAVPTILNPVVIETSTKRPLLADSVDMPRNVMANSTFDMYSECAKSFSNIQKNTPEDLHFENKNEGSKTRGNLESTENSILKNEKAKKNNLLPETDVLHYMEEGIYSSPNPPILSSPGTSEEIRVKLDPDCELICSVGESSVSRPAGNSTIGDGSKLSGLYCENGQDQQSPCSDDSAGSNYGIDGKAERNQLPQGLQVSSLKYSSPYNKLASTHSSKLFATCIVCGKQLSNQYNLRVHMETHQNVNYACRVCNHVSRSRDALRKHVSYRHPKENKDRLPAGGVTREDRVQPTGSNGTSGSYKKPKLFTNNDVK